MGLLSKTEDIFKPAEPGEIEPRRKQAEIEWIRKMKSMPKEELIDSLVERDMEALDDGTIQWFLRKGLVGYENMSRDKLIEVYKDYFGGWEDEL